jgi:glycosyltransferase involved in cell wall biosynthesis
MEDLELTILMPCLNEAQTLRGCIGKALAFLQRERIRGEVLISDNGSTDGSQELARSLGARVIDTPVRGYGAALGQGIAAARGHFVIMGDSDGSYDFSALDRFVASLRAGAQLVMGNRFKGGISAGAMPMLHRYLGNPVLSFVGRLFFRTRIRDFHCGLRGFSRDAIMSLGLVTGGMEFASEMVAKAALAGLRIEEVPAALYPDGRDRPPHLNTWRDGWRHLRFLLLFCPRWLFLYPGLVGFLVGTAGLLLLHQGGIEFSSVGLGIHSMLYMAGLVILGAQMIQLALLTRWIGALSGISPMPSWLGRWIPFIKLESGLIAGVTLFLLGLAWSFRLVSDWRFGGFGPLQPEEGMRSAIPAVTLMILGVQAAAGALFAGAIHFSWRSSSPVRTNP